MTNKQKSKTVKKCLNFYLIGRICAGWLCVGYVNGWLDPCLARLAATEKLQFSSQPDAADRWPRRALPSHVRFTWARRPRVRLTWRESTPHHTAPCCRACNAEQDRRCLIFFLLIRYWPDQQWFNIEWWELSTVRCQHQPGQLLMVSSYDGTAPQSGTQHNQLVLLGYD